MFCPQCGQQQISAETRFCSRCGLPLNLVAEVLAGGGSLPQLEELYKGKNKFFTRKNGLIFSLFWFLFFVLILTPFWGILDVGELAGMSAILGIFGGLIIMLSSFFFLKPESKNFSNQYDLEAGNFSPNSLYGNKNQNALPPQQTIPADFYAPPSSGWKAPDTGDLGQPSSVTEETTKLLNKDKF
ncbi:hypothetical protein BH20ACI4_BH20ACI4_09630 [soil metagenome]